jgi:putative phage-type endonuclease
MILYPMEECALELMEEYVQENVEHIHSEKFTQKMIEQVIDLLCIQLEIDPLYPGIPMAIQAAYSMHRGRTSMTCEVQSNVGEKLNRLRQQYQPEQRSEEWYTIRHQLLTASSIYKVIGTDSKKNEIICNKCAPVNIHHSSYTDSPMHWGIKYEQVSTDYYCYINQTKIQSYGCIIHPTYPFIGASPDGINILESSHCFGRMLEIKNPYTREITGNPKEEYWVQCQVQMEVCDLDVCDFLETKFVEYPSVTEFENDGTFQITSDGKYKGIIIHFEVNNEYHYEYAPFQCTKDEYNEWEETVMIQYPTYIKTIYWKLEDEHCTIITRNKEWFQWFLPKIIEVQTIIENEKSTDLWMKRLPQKRCKISIN